jgi:alanine racemase
MPLIRAVIDTAALRANLDTVRARAPGSKVMAVVKANAYGHGLVMTAVGLPQADAFAVARLEEGIMLREAGITRPIILLEGVFNAEQLLEAAVHRFEVVVHDPLQVTLQEAFRGSFRFTAWLKIDTGINRLGFRRIWHGPMSATHRPRRSRCSVFALQPARWALPPASAIRPGFSAGRMPRGIGCARAWRCTVFHPSQICAVMRSD